MGGGGGEGRRAARGRGEGPSLGLGAADEVAGWHACGERHRLNEAGNGAVPLVTFRRRRYVLRGKEPDRQEPERNLRRFKGKWEVHFSSDSFTKNEKNDNESE